MQDTTACMFTCTLQAVSHAAANVSPLRQQSLVSQARPLERGEAFLLFLATLPFLNEIQTLASVVLLHCCEQAPDAVHGNTGQRERKPQSFAVWCSSGGLPIMVGQISCCCLKPWSDQRSTCFDTTTKSVTKDAHDEACSHCFFHLHSSVSTYIPSQPY